MTPTGMTPTYYVPTLFYSGSPNIFVFGSNLGGIHGAGAAKFAKLHCGASYGVGYGLHGQSFAIPTKDPRIRTLPIPEINRYVRGFTEYATMNPHLTFYLTPVGTGLAGYNARNIAPLFKDSPPNVIIPHEFAHIIRK